MSAFEFILVLVSVVAGFAVSEILSGWGRLIRERVRIMDVAVYLLASIWLLLMITRYIWVLWLFREIDWRFIDFMMAFVPILVLALAAYLTNPVRAASFLPKAHYQTQARPFCYLMTVYFIAWSFGIQRAYIEGGAVLGPTQILGLGSALMFLVLAHIKRQSLHALGFTVALVGIVVMSTIAITNLVDEPPL